MEVSTDNSQATPASNEGDFRAVLAVSRALAGKLALEHILDLRHRSQQAGDDPLQGRGLSAKQCIEGRPIASPTPIDVRLGGRGRPPYGAWLAHCLSMIGVSDPFCC